MQGALRVWKNFMVGWQMRYLILENDTLSIYKEKNGKKKATYSIRIAKITDDENPKVINIHTGTR